jgi:osmotically-inducible protein OsmY
MYPNLSRMKTLLVFLLGIVIGVLGWRYYERSHWSGSADDFAGHTREKATDFKDKVVDEAKVVGAEAGDARIIGVIKGKYLLDKDLSTLAITVNCHNGKVVLTGSAGSRELIARAADLARATDGVHAVNNQLTVKN